MENIGNILNTGSEGISKLRTKNPLTWLMLFNPFSNLTALTQNQAIPSVAITIKRNPRVQRKPFRKELFFLDLLDLLQQQQKDIPMTILVNIKVDVSRIIN